MAVGDWSASPLPPPAIEHDVRWPASGLIAHDQDVVPGYRHALGLIVTRWKRLGPHHLAPRRDYGKSFLVRCDQYVVSRRWVDSNVGRLEVFPRIGPDHFRHWNHKHAESRRGGGGI